MIKDKIPVELTFDEFDLIRKSLGLVSDYIYATRRRDFQSVLTAVKYFDEEVSELDFEDGKYAEKLSTLRETLMNAAMKHAGE